MSPRKSAAIYEPTESELHQSVAEYLDWALLPPAVYSTFPSGWGKLGGAMAGRLKASGLKPGMPDIFVFDSFPMIANRKYPKVVGIELKARDNKPTAAQQLMFPRLRGLGIPVHVCECIEDVEAALRQESIALRFGFGGHLKWHDVQQERRKRQLDETSEKHAEQDAGDGDGAAQRTAG